MSESQTNEQGIFDPKRYRLFSMLPDVDSDEAYCVRHDVGMSEVPIDVSHEGAVYTTKERFTAYTCMLCHKEMESDPSKPNPKQTFRWYLRQAFDAWDDGEAPGDWFKYRCEAEDYDGSVER